MNAILKKIVHKAIVQIKKYQGISLDEVRRIKIINSLNIELVFDVGANTGQYALRLRRLGYKNKVVSFEPLSNAFEELKKNSLRDKNWIVNNYALGDEDSTTFINVAGNSYSSSISNMLPKHIESAPDSKFIGKEKIEIKKLDSILGSFCKESEKNVMLKIDTQGYEKNVLDGAANVLNRIKIIQIEMSLVPLYENEMLFNEMIEHLMTKGFILFSVENGFYNTTTGQLLQVDGIFVNTHG